MKLFISYRRADSQYVTDIVYDKMVHHFGKDNVFLDVGSIPFGVDFRQYLSDQIKAHDIVLVVIGPDWAQIMKERANQQNDFVRIEIENALQQNKLVIPVLVKNATMPDFSDLPESIQELQWRNSAIVRRQPDLENDCTRLAESIKQYFQSNVGTGLALSAIPTTSPKSSSIDILPPPFAWIDIPNKNYGIAKYPITNAQYAKFIEAGGYQNRDWWTEEGWILREKENWIEPRYWNDKQWNGSEYPVVGVSWFEAVAFCLWLGDVTGENVMLPTEDQWQYAAQGDDGRAYPWGNMWNGELCNNSVGKKGIGKTTLVTHYEGKGDSPFGVVGMAGNIWEWCLTDYNNKMNDVNSITNRRVLHGGSWVNSNATNFRCDYRGGRNPMDSNSNGSFRIARI